MYMSVNHVFRMPFFEIIIETLESPVRKVIHISVSPGRRVCQQDIASALEERVHVGAQDAPFHFLFCVHIFAGMVIHGAAEPHDAETFIIVQFVFNAYTAIRSSVLIAIIVIAPDVKQREIGHGYKKFEVFRLDISCGEDKVHSPDFFGFIIIPESCTFLIGNSQYLHNISS